jgi:hypothetical protein
LIGAGVAALRGRDGEALHRSLERAMHTWEAVNIMHGQNTEAGRVTVVDHRVRWPRLFTADHEQTAWQTERLLAQHNPIEARFTCLA